jgi:hypothetical protein
MDSDSLQLTEDRSAANATHPRVTLDSMKAKIKHESYVTQFRPLTICVIETTSGFYIVGDSCPASPENYKEALGKQLAYEDAIRQMWKLEGYLLRNKLGS